MKIKSIETFTKNQRLCVVRINTDSGAEGFGQTAPFNADITAKVLHRQIAPLVLGADPLDIDSIVFNGITENYKFPWSYVCRALGGVETALWDLKGKLENKPVCELIGGKLKPIPIYGSSMSRDIIPEDEAKRLVRLRESNGFEAFKIRIGGMGYGQDKDQWHGRTDALVPAVRKAIGHDCKLLVDANSSYTPTKAIEVGKMLEQNNVCHFEEPCPYPELEWTAKVSDALDIPVAGGEQDNDIAQWRRMINMHAVDIIQPDICYIGGLTRMLQVAKMGEEKKIPCVPHSANLSMLIIFTGHVLVSIPNAGPYMEYCIEDSTWENDLYSPRTQIKDGKTQMPDGPGWGITVNPAWLEKAGHEISD